jgi:hypothetical protein
MGSSPQLLALSLLLEKSSSKVKMWTRPEARYWCRSSAATPLSGHALTSENRGGSESAVAAALCQRTQSQQILFQSNGYSFA